MVILLCIAMVCALPTALPSNRLKTLTVNRRQQAGMPRTRTAMQQTALGAAGTQLLPFMLVVLITAVLHAHASTSSSLSTVVAGGTGIVAVSLAVAMSGLCLWKLWRSATQRRTVKRQQRYLASLLGLVIGDLRAGCTVDQALEQAIAELQEEGNNVQPIPQQLSAAVRALRMGTSAPAQLADHPNNDVKLIATCWAVAERHGVALAHMLEQAQLRITTGLEHSQRTEAELQGPKATAITLSLLPLLGLGLGRALGADALRLFFTTTIGHMLMLGGVGCLCAGALWSQRIIYGATSANESTRKQSAGA